MSQTELKNRNSPMEYSLTKHLFFDRLLLIPVSYTHLDVYKRQGFGGIGAMLRYKVNFEQLVDESEDEYYDEDEGSDYDFI